MNMNDTTEEIYNVPRKGPTCRFATEEEIIALMKQTGKTRPQAISHFYWHRKNKEEYQRKKDRPKQGITVYRRNANGTYYIWREL